MLTFLIYTTLLEYLKRTNIHDDNTNELLDAIIFFRIQFKVKVLVYIFHNLETSSNKSPIVNSKLI